MPWFKRNMRTHTHIHNHIDIPGTQLSAQVSNSGNMGGTVTSISQTSGAQLLNVGSQLGASNLIVNSSVRTLPPTVRVLPPLSHHNSRSGKEIILSFITVLVI